MRLARDRTGQGILLHAAEGRKCPQGVPLLLLTAGGIGRSLHLLPQPGRGGQLGPGKKLIVHDSAAENSSPIIVSMGGVTLVVGASGTDVGGNLNQGTTNAYWLAQKNGT